MQVHSVFGFDMSFAQHGVTDDVPEDSYFPKPASGPLPEKVLYGAQEQPKLLRLHRTEGLAQRLLRLLEFHDAQSRRSQSAQGTSSLLRE